MKNLSEFTNLYSLQKTLKFELKPVGKDGKELSIDESEKLLKKIVDEDKKIKEAYVALKPVMDKIHETAINESLNSEKAKNIEFNDYFQEYKKGKVKKLDQLEKSLREKIGETFDEAGNKFSEKANELVVKNEEINSTKEKKKDKKTLKKEGIKSLTESGILKYIEKNIADLVPKEKISEYLTIEEITNKKGKIEIKRSGYLETFSGFFTYFSKYNENRLNYYEFNKEASTSVATRIVHENLHKFCDNIIQFSEEKKIKNRKTKQEETIPSRKQEYLNAYKFLQESKRTTQIKDTKTNQMIEAEEINEEFFEIKKFSECLSQSGIDEYNRIIGHYNQLINLYNQANITVSNFRKLSQFKTLFKQIGCGDKKSLFFQLKYDTKEQQKSKESSQEILSLEGALEKISIAGEKYFTRINEVNNEIKTIFNFIDFLKENEHWEGIYCSKSALTKISNSYFANWHVIKDYIQKVFESKDKDQKEILKSVASFDKKREEQLKMNDAIELSVLFDIIDQDNTEGWCERFFKESILEDKKSVINEKNTPSKNLVNLICNDIENFANVFLSQSSNVLRITRYKDENEIKKIKDWLDTAKLTLMNIKFFDVKENKTKGNSINSDFSELVNGLLRPKDADWLNWYDDVRNYLSKKPQDDAKKNKLKLNFGNPVLLGGWSQEYNTKAGLIFEKEGLYYFVINDKQLSENEVKLLENEDENSLGRRIILDFQKPDNKNVPRLFIRSKGENFAPAVKKYNLPIADVLEIYDQEKFKTEYKKKNEKEFKESLHKLIDYFKKGFSLHESYKHYNFSWKTTTQYNDISEFYHDTEVSCFKIKFQKVNWQAVLDFVKNQKFYLFQIYNKDFSQNKKSNGSDNIHTFYWKNLFTNENLKDVIYKLNGQAEIFYRKEAIQYKPEYDINGREKGHHYIDKNLKEKFEYPIISNKRYTTDKFHFHCPITLNFKAIRNDNIDNLVNSNYTKSENIQFLGIDRGEKHLIYFSLLNSKGEIIEQGNFDIINNKNYLEAINGAAKLRREKQENWQQKGNISNLKDGYISLVIHEIIQKMKDKDGNFKPTFIIQEDLNSGFKRGRQKFEQQVYQKFELALAKKLNYLVDKKAKMGEVGSVSKALQLTPPVSNYKDIEDKKQFGVMLYTRANYTSITDPATGWRKTIYLKKGTEKEIQNQIFEVFTEISIDENGDYFFEYKEKNAEKIWKLWSSKNGSSLERYRAKRGKDKNEYIIESKNVKEILDKLFEQFDKSKSLLAQLKENKELPKVNEHPAWESLRFAIDIIQQIRNSGDVSKNQDDNFLLSPVRNENGEHFESRKSNSKLPIDADANGAFNIACKGMIMYEHIKFMQNNNLDPKDLDLFVSDEEWDLWNLDRETWLQNLEKFSKRTKKEDSKKSKTKSS